jgi:hypothetical protein
MKLTYDECPSISTVQVRQLLQCFPNLILRDKRGNEGRLIKASEGVLYSDDFSCRNCDYREIEIVFKRELLIRADEYPDLTIDELILMRRYWHGQWGPVKLMITGRWGDVQAYQAPCEIVADKIALLNSPVLVALPTPGYYWIKIYVDS